MRRCSPHQSVACLCASVHTAPALVLWLWGGQVFWRWSQLCLARLRDPTSVPTSLAAGRDVPGPVWWGGPSPAAAQSPCRWWPCNFGAALMLRFESMGSKMAGHPVACHFLGYVARMLDLVAFPQSCVFSWSSDFRGLWLASVSCMWWGWDPGEGLQCPAKWTSSFCLNLTLIFGTMGDLFLEPRFSETHLHATLPGFLVQIFCHLLLRQSVVSVLDEVL